jgi:hypothetical protein
VLGASVAELEHVGIRKELLADPSTTGEMARCEENEIVLFGMQPIEGVIPAAGIGGLLAFGDECRAHHTPDLRLVIHHENASFAHAHIAGDLHAWSRTHGFCRRS